MLKQVQHDAIRGGAGKTPALHLATYSLPL